MDATSGAPRPTIGQSDVVRVGLIEALRQVVQELSLAIGPDREGELTDLRNRIIGEAPVSYTHLTLPTIYSV